MLDHVFLSVSDIDRSVAGRRDGSRCHRQWERAGVCAAVGRVVRGPRLMDGRLFAGDPLVGFTRRELEHPMLQRCMTCYGPVRFKDIL